MVSCNSTARLVLSPTRRSDATCAMTSSRSSFFVRSATDLRARFHAPTPTRTTSSAPITATSRPGVHHEGRASTRRLSEAFTTTNAPFTFGNTEFGRQLSATITHTPRTSTVQPIASPEMASGHELKSIGSRFPSHSRISRLSPSLCGSPRTMPVAMTVRP